jgi:hypothetical protein
MRFRVFIGPYATKPTALELCVERTSKALIAPSRLPAPAIG